MDKEFQNKESKSATNRGKKIKKILANTCVAIVGVVGLVAAYQLLKFLFVGAILLVAWINPKPWWR